ncbi:DUF2799 domain-containing protein [Microbulbifer sp. OS29]|uniref:DUF2799 domain-containing protein n=1 Tax=Microbulbifer okhotskensis TaxID=2926617 RepID=A0A9X2J4Y3_9GAMM|nr:DUF2799 domain-containing protein [Microbulbifer okhotskensis]MCO1334633.1 DUF2799 domain-containing protein [Microbulbifer okhotskensis]
MFARKNCFFLIALLLGLSGCAVISEEECRVGLWYERGLQDGARGRPQSQVYDIARECQNYDMPMDSEAWLQGHEEGVETFCTAENGYDQGRRGRNYQGVCTGPAADLFLLNYERGLAEYRVEQHYQSLLWRRDSLQRELLSLRHAYRNSDSEVQLRALHFQRSRLRWELQMLDMELHRYGLFGSRYSTSGFYPRGFFSARLFYW